MLPIYCVFLWFIHCSALNTRRLPASTLFFHFPWWEGKNINALVTNGQQISWILNKTYKGNGITPPDLDLTWVETRGGAGSAKYSCLFFVYLSFKALFCILKQSERTDHASMACWRKECGVCRARPTLSCSIFRMIFISNACGMALGLMLIYHSLPAAGALRLSGWHGESFW